MYLQFTPAPQKKLQTVASVPLLNRERSHHYATSAVREENSPKVLVSQGPFNKYLSQIDSQHNQPQTQRPHPPGRQKSEEIADDLKALHKGLRHMISTGNLNNYHVADNHTKHRILNRHLTKTDPPTLICPSKDDGGALKLASNVPQQRIINNDINHTQKMSPVRHIINQRPQEYLIAQSNHVEYSPDKNTAMGVNVPTASTISYQTGKYINPPKDESHRLHEEISLLQQENQRQQQSLTKFKEQNHRLTQLSRKMCDELKHVQQQLRYTQVQLRRSQDQISSANNRSDHLIKQNQHQIRQFQAANSNKIILEERLKLLEQKLRQAQVSLQNSVDYQQQTKDLKEKLITLEIEIQEKTTQIQFLTQKVLSIQDKENDQKRIDAAKYEETIEALQRQLRHIRLSRPEPTSKPSEFNEILRDNIIEVQRLKDELKLKDEQLCLLKDEMNMQKYKLDNFKNQIQMQRLKAMTEKKNAQVQYDIREQNNLNEINSLKKLLIAIEEKYRISFNDNLRKDDFVKNHIIGKTKSQYDRNDIENFFKQYEAQVPKDSLRKTLMKQLIQIKQFQEKIIDLETALAASQQLRRSLQSDPLEESPH